MATARKPGVLVLLRHGQSTWNLENLFTGWHDVPLSERGVGEAKEAGRLMKEAGLAPGVVHTSLLVRAIQSADLALAEMERTGRCRASTKSRRRRNTERSRSGSGAGATTFALRT